MKFHHFLPPPWKYRFDPLEKSTIVPPEKNISDAHDL